MCSIFGYSGKTIPEKELREAFLKTTSRGPDDMRFIPLEKGFMGFQRLAIMGLTRRGCSLLRWAATVLSATARYTASDR